MNAQGPEPFRIGSVTVDIANERLTGASGQAITLRRQSFAVLRRLAATPDQLVTKSALMDEVWPGLAVTDDSLVQCIHEIRRALGPEGEQALRTVPRRGYMLHMPPAEAPGPAPARAGVSAGPACSPSRSWSLSPDSSSGRAEPRKRHRGFPSSPSCPSPMKAAPISARAWPRPSSPCSAGCPKSA